jgi:hypothetical protein
MLASVFIMAKSYKSMIDDSVSKAQIVDTVTMLVVERWV